MLLGIVNAQFCYIQTLKTEEEPDHVVQLINTYCIDVESILSELGSFIDLPDVDFSKLVALAQQVEESSSLMGAEHMRLACADLIQACRQKDKRNLSLSLNWIKNEFAHIRTKLEVVVQMERKIMRLENKHKK
uniref:Histidine-containing phosphotransfer protein n=1 Tax=Salix viminalis TaxID=40686 RepID=A0A6N2L7I6_SALVM